MASKQKTFTYRRSRFNPEPYKKTMQELLEATFANIGVKKRAYQVSDETPHVYFINHISTVQGYFCASFFGYEKGKINHVIGELTDEKEIIAAALPPTQVNGKDGQYLDGKLFFICYKNHMIISQDMAVKGQHLERYLYQKFLELNSDFTSATQFALEKSIARTKRSKIRGVRRINISAPLEYETVPIEPTANAPQTPLRTVIRGKAWQALKEFAGDAIDFSRFETEGVVDPKDVQVTLSLAWKNRNRNETESDQIDAITNALRNIEDEVEIEIETANGKFKRNDLILALKKGVSHNDDMPDSADIFDKMIIWHKELNQSGEI